MDFGFSLSPSSAVHIDGVDLSLYRAVEEKVPEIRTCIGCGSCTATCTAGPYSGMSVRQIILDIQRGRQKLAAEKLDACMLCGKCTMVCPRGINTRGLILAVCENYKKEDPR